MSIHKITQYKYCVFVLEWEHVTLSIIMLLPQPAIGAPIAVSSIADIQYSILKTYLAHTSDKIALQEHALAARTEDILAQLETPSSSKSLRCSTVTDITTASSLCPRIKTEQAMFSPRQRDRRLFKRKGPHSTNRQLGTAAEVAVKQVRERCSEQTTVVFEELMLECDRLSAQLFKGTLSRKSRELCRPCQLKDVEISQMAREHEKTVKGIQEQLQNIMTMKDQISKDNHHLRSYIAQKRQQWQQIQKGRRIFESCRAYLLDRQVSLDSRLLSITQIESQVMSVVSEIFDRDGCLRCEGLHRMKEQFIQFRQYLQQQGQQVDRIYVRYRRFLK